MLTLADIKNLTYEKNFRKGLEIQRMGNVKELEYSIYNVAGNTVAEASASVSDSEDFTAKTSVTVDEDYADIREYRCNCEEMSEYEGMCRHCIAVAAEYVQKRRVKEVLDVKWNKTDNIQRGFRQETSERMKEIMGRYARQQASRYLIPEGSSGQIELYPYFICNTPYHAQVSFKVGTEQKYVIKNLNSFLDSVAWAEKIHYGKKLEFYHNIEAYTDTGKRLIAFIRSCQNHRFTLAGKGGYYSRKMSFLERTIELDEAEIEQFFSAMQGEYFEGEVPDSEDTVWYVGTETKKPRLTITGDANGAIVKLENTRVLYGENRYYFYEKGTILPGPVSLKRDLADFFEYLLKLEYHRCYIASEELPVFCRDLLPCLSKEFDVVMEQFDPQAYLLDQPEFELYLDKLEHNTVAGKVMVVYKDKSYNLLDKSDFATLRNAEEEIRIRHMIEYYFDAVDANKTIFLIRDQEDRIYELLSGGLQRLSEFMTIYASDAFGSMKIHNSPKVSVGLSLKSDLLELKIQSDELPVDQLADLLSKYDRKKKYIRLKNGDFMNLSPGDGIEILAELKSDLEIADSKMAKGTVKIPKYRAMYLDSMMHDGKSLHIEKNKEFKSVVRGMKTIEDSDYEVPDPLKKVMREYQKNGFCWMKTLHDYGFGGILADDMGLGKTLQVISLFVSEAKTQPFLVICPASLVYNWEREILRFAPELPVKIISGSIPEREKQIAEILPGQVVVTSYDLLKRDIQLYQEHTFSIQVIDEAQYIKNPSTQAARAVKKIQAGFKLALTGTPIENRLSELWSIFDYLMPGFLYHYKKFRNEIELPVVAGNDKEQLEHLQKMIRPFVLRRLKMDVLKDLPEKLEETICSKLEGEQLSLYDAHVQQMKRMLEKKSDQEFKKERFEILAELTRLRQICCDPALVFENYKGESAKLSTCMELITAAVMGGHKILLFSQFTTMLDRLQEKLSDAGISYYTLTGSVGKEQRMHLVEQFNQDDTSVFCISLKAGGTGLNLTAADIVIHYDPWWNVAVQNQATDRAYRIGQKNVVTVYKLVTKGTIEEKIIEIQERKKNLANDVLGGEGIDSGTFTREEIMELLG